MRCRACGAEMILTTVVQDDTMGVPGLEHHTFICSKCCVTELRVVLTRHGREDDSEPMPPPFASRFCSSPGD
jgi:hypothetical protein